MRGTLASRSTRVRPFDPRMIAGLLGWWAADRIGDQLASAANLTTWRDLSGGAHTLTAVGTGPTFRLPGNTVASSNNQLPSVRFAGSHYMVNSDAGLCTPFSGSDLSFAVFMAVKSNTIGFAGDFCAWADSTTDNGLLGFGYNATPNWRAQKKDDAATLVTRNTGTPDTNWHIVSASDAGAGTTIRFIVDGVAAISQGLDVGATTLNTFSIGARNNLTAGAQKINAEIGEIIVYARALAPIMQEEHTALMRYLGRRWGVAVAD